MKLLLVIFLCNVACGVVVDSSDEHVFTDNTKAEDQDEPILSAPHVASAKTINVEKKFSRWPRRSHIPYALHNSYSPIEVTNIKSAITQIMSDTSFWITFVSVPVNSSEYKILITPLKSDNTSPEEVCYSYPGMLTIAPKLASMGVKEQRLVLARGPLGCLGGTIHDIMRHLVVVLGKRNEHERGDRGKYIEVHSENLTPAGQSAFRLYTPTEAIWGLFPYDYCSVTHAAQTDFAKPGKLSFTVLQPPFFIPKLNRLSETDCRLLLLLYGGDPAACAPLICADLKGIRLTTATAAPLPIFVTPSVSLPPVTSTLPPVTTESTQDGVTTVCYSFPTTPSIPVNTPSAFLKQEVPSTVTTLATTTPTTTPSTSTTTSRTTEPTTETVKPTTKTTTTTTTTTTTFTAEPTTEPAARLEDSVTDVSLSERGEGISCAESFCSAPIDHASLYWDGNTSILFSGNCSQRINSDFQFVGPPTSLASTLPGSLIYGPIQAAWTNLQNGTYRLHIVDRNGIQRVCSSSACIREEQTARLSPSSSMFLVQSGQSQIFRMFSLDGSQNIIDMLRQQTPVAIRSVNGQTTDQDLVRIDAAWMYYNASRENTVAVIGSDQDGKKYIGEVQVDLTKTPATFTFSSPPLPVSQKLHPCP